MGELGLLKDSCPGHVRRVTALQPVHLGAELWESCQAHMCCWKGTNQILRLQAVVSLLVCWLLPHRSVPTFNYLFYDDIPLHSVYCEVPASAALTPCQLQSSHRTRPPLQALAHQSCASLSLLWSAESPHVHLINHTEVSFGTSFTTLP